MRLWPIPVLRTSAAALTMVFVTTAFAATKETTPAKFVVIKSPVIRGLQAHLVANVGAAKRCEIVVFKRNPYVQMRSKRNRWGFGLYPKHPDNADGGRIAWEWKVGSHTRLGRWWVHVSCGPAVSIRTSFRVVPWPA
jgi:hypothetical protein